MISLDTASSSTFSTSSTSSPVSSPSVALVLDIGSSSIRCSAVKLDDHDVFVSAREPSSLSLAGTLDPSSVLSSVLTAIKASQLSYFNTHCLPSSSSSPSSSSCFFTCTDLVVTCVAMALVGTDPETGEAVTPVLTYAGRDPAAVTAASSIAALVGGAASLHDTSGAPLHPAYAPAQITAWRAANSSNRSRIVWTSLSSWIISRLLDLLPLHVGIARSEVAWSGLLNLSTGDWNYDITTRVLGIAKEDLPSIRPTSFFLRGGCDALPFSSEVSSYFPFADKASGSASGFPSGSASSSPSAGVRFWVGANAGDGAAAAVGSGALETATLALTIGTSAAIRTVLPRKTALEMLCAGHGAEASSDSSSSSPYACPHCGKLRLSSLGLWCYPFTDAHVLVGGALTDGGSLVDYFASSFGASSPSTPSSSSSSSSPSPGPTSQGLLCLPFWSGERATGWSASARGCFYGLTYAHGPQHMLVAAMEGVAFRLRAIFDRLRLIASEEENKAGGGHVEASWRVIGSGAGLTKSPYWAQIVADTLGVPVSVASEPASISASSAAAGGGVSASPPPTPAAEALEATSLGAFLLMRIAISAAEHGGDVEKAVVPALAASAASHEAGSGSAAEAVGEAGVSLFLPDPSKASSIAEQYHKHTRLYEALAPLHAEIGV